MYESIVLIEQMYQMQLETVYSLYLHRRSTQVLKATMSTVSGAICVSHTCRDNFILRAHLPPSIVHVIPNAVDPSKFVPDPSKRREDRCVVIVFLTLLLATY